ncbi:phosphoenolpyruvate--protein phosphotransferase [Agromyces soli]
MQQLHGIGIGTGVAVGPLARLAPRLPRPAGSAPRGDASAELERARSAVAGLATELRARGDAAGGAAREVLEAQALMAEDPSVLDDVERRLAAGDSAELAVFDAFTAYGQLLAGLGGHLGERAADVEDVAQRALARLLGVAPPAIPDPGHPFVLVADDLAPADTAALDLERVLALVTRAGGPTSHTAILAREHGLVAVVGVEGSEALADGVELVVDAERGLVLAEPGAVERREAEARRAAHEALAAAPVHAGALADGTAVPLYANLGSADGAADAVALGAEGVGLFRTEFLFLDAQEAPSREAQRGEYARLFAAFPGRKVVVRVLDAGADKPLAFLNDDEEPNPALGVRGIRALRRSEGVLREQLAAISDAAAASEAQVQVMAPMVSTVEEAAYFAALVAEAGLPAAGVMIETPAAALIADRVLAVCDFASIGTNDLVQYTMAADRLLGGVAGLQSPWHPAVLRLVGDAARAGAGLGKPVGVCGEAAADPLLAVVLVGLGVTSLSMAPASLAEVRAELGRHTLDDARRLADLALAAAGADEARESVRDAVRDAEPGADLAVGTAS